MINRTNDNRTNDIKIFTLISHVCQDLNIIE